MPTGEYNIKLPKGTYNVTASKKGYTIQVVENTKVVEDQTTVLNFELIGGENMEHIIDINITNCDEETIEVPDGCANKVFKFIGVISNNPLVGLTLELLAADGNTVIQTQTTDANGLASFTNLIYNNYKLRIV